MIIGREEWRDQAAVITWAQCAVAEHPELAYLNGSLNGVRLTIGQAAKARRCGMKKGFPDLSLPVTRGLYAGLYIELKPLTRGKKNPRRPRLDPEQERWVEFLRSQGYCAAVCCGSDEAINFIKSYLNQKRRTMEE